MACILLIDSTYTLHQQKIYNPFIQVAKLKILSNCSDVV